MKGDHNLVLILVGMAHFCHFDVHLEGTDLQIVKHFQKIMFQCFFNNLLWRLVTSVWNGFNLNYFYFYMFRNAKDDAMEIMAIMKECGNFMADIYRIGKVFKNKLLLPDSHVDKCEEIGAGHRKQFQENTDNIIQMKEPYQMLHPTFLENQNQQFPLDQSMYPQENFSEFMTEFNQVVFNETQESVQKI